MVASSPSLSEMVSLHVAVKRLSEMHLKQTLQELSLFRCSRASTGTVGAWNSR